MSTIQLPTTNDPFRTFEIDPTVVVSITPTTEVSCTISTRGGDHIRVALSADETSRRLSL